MSRLTYPEKARRSHATGQVIVQAIVDSKGEVDSINVWKPAYYPLNEAAVEAVRDALFQPAMKGGQPVKAKICLPFTFELR